MLFVLPEVGLVVAQRPSSKHGGMCLLVAQTIASDLLLGGGARRLFSNFFIKKQQRTVCLLCCNICPQARGCFLGYISSPCCSSRRGSFFFCPTKKNTSPFVGGAVQTGLFCLPVLPPPLWLTTRSSRTDKQALFSVYVDSINNISWSKRKVGPVVYVTELGTLESATAPLADCPHAVIVSDWRIKNNTHSDHFTAWMSAFFTRSIRHIEQCIPQGFGCMSTWVGVVVCSR